jgi:hypothetical protein
MPPAGKSAHLRQFLVLTGAATVPIVRHLLIREIYVRCAFGSMTFETTLRGAPVRNSSCTSARHCLDSS